MKKIDYKWIALSCTSLGALISVLSGSTLIIALPEIMKDLNAGLGTIMWTVMSYMLVLTIFVPAIGRVADMMGRKKLYVGGFAVFTLASVLCAIANSGLQLLAFRAIQSVGGALLVANSTPIVADAFPKKELGKAMGINSMIISIASVVGPILGGFLLNYGWRSVFYINIPIGIAGTIWAAIGVKELDVIPEKQKFDWKGTITFSFAILLFLIALSLGGFVGWFNGMFIGSFAASILLFAWFVSIENKAEQPMLDMRLLKNRVLAFAFGSTLLNGIARGAVTFLLILYFQGIKGIDPILAGIMLTPFAVGMMLVSPVSGWLSDKYGARELSSAGLVISAAGLIGFMRITNSSSLVELSIWMFITGAGSGFFFSPNTTAIMGSVPSDKRGIAAGIRTMMNNAGSVISIALAMAVISSSITPEALQGLFIGTQVGDEGIAVSQFVAGLRTVFTVSFAFTLLAAVISYMRGEQPNWENTEIVMPDNN